MIATSRLDEAVLQVGQHTQHDDQG
jgi:hypothetical protein